MSYNCQACGKPQPAGVKQTKHVAETRQREYENIVRPLDGRPFTTTGQGFETVKEIAVCPSCSEALAKGIPLTALSPKKKRAPKPGYAQPADSFTPLALMGKPVLPVART